MNTKRIPVAGLNDPGIQHIPVPGDERDARNAVQPGPGRGKKEEVNKKESKPDFSPAWPGQSIHWLHGFRCLRKKQGLFCLEQRQQNRICRAAKLRRRPRCFTALCHPCYWQQASSAQLNAPRYRCRGRPRLTGDARRTRLGVRLRQMRQHIGEWESSMPPRLQVKSFLNGRSVSCSPIPLRRSEYAPHTTRQTTYPQDVPVEQRRQTYRQHTASPKLPRRRRL